MKLPFSVPTDTFYGALTFIGMAAIIYAVLVPTNQFDAYKKMQRDAEEEQAIIKVEREYQLKIQQYWQTKNKDMALEWINQEKTLAIREAQLDIALQRVSDARKAWHKSQLWSRAVGLSGIFMTVIGFMLWRRHEQKKITK